VSLIRMRTVSYISQSCHDDVIYMNASCRVSQKTGSSSRE